MPVSQGAAQSAPRHYEVTMKTDQKLNMTMLCDFYELTMGNGYLKAGFQDRITYFDVYFRSVPDGGGYAIAAGLDQLIDYIEDLHFDEQDIEYLRSPRYFLRGVSGLSCELPLHRRYLRRAGGYACFPEGADGRRARARDRGAAARDLRAFDRQPPEPHRHQGQPHRPRRQGPRCDGVRFPPRTGLRRRHRRRSCCLYRGLLRHCLHHLRPALRHARTRHDGPRLGADVRHRI